MEIVGFSTVPKYHELKTYLIFFYPFTRDTVSKFKTLTKNDPKQLKK